MPADTNFYGDVFGGWLLSQADIAGGTVAIQAAQGRVATVAVNEFRFLAPVLVGDLVDLYARLERVGTTSLTVGVRAWARRELDPESREQVAQATISYVAIGEDGNPRPVEAPTEPTAIV
ncbi:MAG: acyl-CoA thioesterase [Chromatiaceae bacterium]|nr:acyl-CoA thioesterase [Chromatiaceae bacterium]